MNIKLCLLGSVLGIYTLIFPTKAVHGGGSSCLSAAQTLGKTQKGFLDAFDQAFLHPGVYVSPTRLSNDEIERLEAQYETVPGLAPEAYTLALGILSYDSLPYRYALVEQAQFEKVVKDIEHKQLWQQLENLSAKFILKQLVEYANELNDLSVSGSTLTKSRNTLRNDPVLLQTTSRYEYVFHNVNKMRERLNAAPKALQAYNYMVDVLTKHGKELTSADMWRESIYLTLKDTPNSSVTRQVQALLKKHFRIIPGGQAVIEQQMLAMLETISQRLKAQDDPVSVAAFAHQRLIDIHPFEDGNGRIARLLMNLILRSGGLLSVPILSDEGYMRTVQKALNTKDNKIFEAYLAKKLCVKVKNWGRYPNSYGKDIQDLVKNCAQQVKQTAQLQGDHKEAVSAHAVNSLVQGCKRSFAELIQAYEAETLPKEEL